MGLDYFFDTYAVIELMRKNPAFEKYIDIKINITFFNLVEIAYITALQQGLQSAQEAFNHFKEFVVDVPSNVLFTSILFRLEHRKKSLSYADCVGYTYAKTHNLLFLTGDDAFKHLQNVEFVK